MSKMKRAITILIVTMCAAFVGCSANTPTAEPSVPLESASAEPSLVGTTDTETDLTSIENNLNAEVVLYEDPVWLDKYGIVFIQNNNSIPIGLMEVNISFLDKTGNIIDAQSNYFSGLLPNSKFAAKLYKVSEDVETAEVSFSSIEPTLTTLTNESMDDLVEIEVAEIDEGLLLNANNISGGKLHLRQVVAFYNGNELSHVVIGINNPIDKDKSYSQKIDVQNHPFDDYTIYYQDVSVEMDATENATSTQNIPNENNQISNKE